MRRARAHGSVMVLAIFFMMVVTFLAYAYLALIPSELKSANRFVMDNEASLVADAGIQDTMAYLRQELDANREPFPGMTSADYTETRNGSLGDWDWEVEIECDPQTFPRGSMTSGRVYKLTSVASFNGTPVRRIETFVQAGESLARWAWLVNNSVANLGAFAGRFEGPVHVNGSVTMSNLGNVYSGSGPPVFGNGASFSGLVGGSPDGVGYDSDPYDWAGNPIPARYEKIYQGGRPGLTAGAAPINFPIDAAPQAAAAWQAGPAPTTPGVHFSSTVPGELDGGVYIVGDVDEMVLGVDLAGNSTMTITQGADVHQVIEATDGNFVSPGGTTVLEDQTLYIAPDGTETVFTNLPNGMVYGTGNINSLYGTNRGKRTIAVDMAANKDIRLTHNLLRADTTPGDDPTGARDTLGLVAQNVRIADFPPAERGNILFYAAILAGRDGTGGGLVIENTSVSPPAYFRVFGSHVEAGAHTKGTIGGGWLWSSAAATGYWPRVKYDPYLANEPPPFYPTAGGKCKIRSWRESVIVP